MDFYSLCSYSQCIINVLVLLAYKWKKPISWALNGCMLPVGTDLYCFYVFLCIWVVGWVSVLRLDSFNVIRSHVWVLLLWMMSIYIRNDGVDLFNVVSARSDQPRWSSSGQEKITLHSSSFNLKVKPSFSFFSTLVFLFFGEKYLPLYQLKCSVHARRVCRLWGGERRSTVGFSELNQSSKHGPAAIKLLEEPRGVSTANDPVHSTFFKQLVGDLNTSHGLHFPSAAQPTPAWLKSRPPIFPPSDHRWSGLYIFCLF